MIGGWLIGNCLDYHKFLFIFGINENSIARNRQTKKVTHCKVPSDPFKIEVNYDTN